jgi:parvulin-like peptidyl-prolyl isomerase
MPYRWLCISLVVLGLAVSCGLPEKAEPAKEDKVLVTVNGVPVTARDVERRIRSLHGDIDLESSSPDLRQRMAEEAVEAEIVDRLLLEAAEEEGITVEREQIDREIERTREVMEKKDFRAMLDERGAAEDDFRSFVRDQMIIRTFQDRLYAEIEVEEEVLEEYFDGHREKFREPERVRLHVVIAESPERAGEVMEGLEKGLSFEDMADEFAKEGVRVSRTRFMPVDALPEGLREEVLSAAAGEVVSNESETGEVTIAKVLERKDARQMEFAEAGELVRNTILQSRRMKALDNWYQGRIRTAIVEYQRPERKTPEKPR